MAEQNTFSVPDMNVSVRIYLIMSERNQKMHRVVRTALDLDHKLVILPSERRSYAAGFAAIGSAECRTQRKLAGVVIIITAPREV